MSRTKEDRNHTIVIAYYKGSSVRELGRKYHRTPSTIHALIARHRKKWTPDERGMAEKNRLRSIALKHAKK